MIRQDSTRSITLTTSQVGIEFTFSGIARTASAAPALITNNTTVATGPVTVSAAPAAGTTNEWDHITLKNTYAGANTVEMKSVGANTTHDFYGVLQQNESAEYVHGNGWKTLDAAGQEKITVGGTAGNFAVGANLTVAGTSVFTDAATFNAGISIPTGQNVTGAGTATVTGFATVSATTLTGTLSTAAQPNVTSTGNLTLGVANTTNGRITVPVGTGLEIYANTTLVGTFTNNNLTLTGSLTAGAISGTTGAFSGDITRTATGATNADLILNSTVGNGYGARVQQIIKTSGGVSTTWLVGPGTTTGDARWEVNGAGTPWFYIAPTGLATAAGGLAVTGTISTTATSGTGTAVIIDGSSILRPLTSSERFKTITEPNWQPSDAQIAAFLAVSPMVSHYTDNDFGPMEGFSAERLAKVDPLLVNMDKNGKPYSLREHAILAYQHAIIAKLYKAAHP